MGAKNKYWVCIIGPCEESKLPNGSDSPIRNAAKSAFFSITKKHPNYTWSGWGVNEKRKEAILKAMTEEI